MAEPRQALVFDYDGVIADTEPLHWKSWAALLARYGIQLGWEEYCRIGQGVSDAELFRYFGAQMPPTACRRVFKPEPRTQANGPRMVDRRMPNSKGNN